MAIFNTNSATTLPQFMRETTDHLFIRGQAHTKATLKPIYGVQLANVSTINGWMSHPNSSNYAYGSDGAHTTVSSTNANAYMTTCHQTNLNGFVLRKTIPVEQNRYLLISYNSSGNAHINEVNSSGASSLLATYNTDIHFLFNNSTHAFLFSSDSSSLYAVGGAQSTVNTSVVAVNMTTGGITGVTPSYSSIYAASTTSAITYENRGISSLISYNESEKTADVIRVNYSTTTSTGLFTWANSALETINGKEGSGTFSTRSITAPVNRKITAYSAYHFYWLRGRPQFTNTFDGVDGKKYFFMYEEGQGVQGSDYNGFYCMSYDPATTDPVTGIAVVTDVVEPTVMVHSGSGYRIRLIERDDHFYVVRVQNIQKAINLTPNEANRLTVTVFKGYYDNPSQLTVCGTYYGSDNYFTYEIFDMLGDFTQLMLIHHNANSQVLVFNEAAEEYYVQSTFDYRVKSIMKDDLNRIWITNQSNAVHLQGPSVGNTVKVGFKDTNLEYKGQQINTELSVACYNYLGERVANNVTVQIEGGVAYFSANGESTITVMTSTTGDLPLPVTISGNGYVRVIANMAL